QAEDGIRDRNVTGVQTCALPISGGDLVAELLDRRGRRTDPGQPRVDDGLGEVRTFGEEAVAGMDRVGAGAVRDVQDLVDHQVGAGGRGAAERVEIGRAHV